MRIDIVANGVVKNFKYLKKELKKSNYIICADGGMKIIQKIKIKPDLLIGDFDSINPVLLKKIKKRKVKIKIYPEEKDKSDLELALDEAIKLSPDEIYIWGALGKRIDHELFNVFLLLKYPKNHIKLVDKNIEIFLINEFFELKGLKGKVVSFLPLSPKIKNLSLDGFEYNLKNKTLKSGRTLLLSNKIKRKNARVKLKKGTLLAIINK